MSLCAETLEIDIRAQTGLKRNMKPIFCRRMLKLPSRGEYICKEGSGNCLQCSNTHKNMLGGGTLLSSGFEKSIQKHSPESV